VKRENFEGKLRSLALADQKLVMLIGANIFSSASTQEIVPTRRRAARIKIGTRGLTHYRCAGGIMNNVRKNEREMSVAMGMKLTK
jgi:hypothetical protein